MSEARTVLLIDDSMTVAKHLTRILVDSGRYRVVGHATDGLEGVKLYRALNPELVCLDIVMPTTDGMETLRLLKQLRPDVKVVMISSIGGIADVVKRALQAGALNVVAKPLDETKVLAVLDAI